MAAVNQIPTKVALLLVKGYRATLSKVIGPKCRFYPSCSAYSLEAFQEFGFLKGFFLSVTRIARCHPLSKGGLDLVPKSNKGQI